MIAEILKINIKISERDFQFNQKSISNQMLNTIPSHRIEIKYCISETKICILMKLNNLPSEYLTGLGLLQLVSQKLFNSFSLCSKIELNFRIYKFV